MSTPHNECANRQAAFKSNGINAEQSRKRRHEVTVALRKSKKEQQDLKRRNISELVSEPQQSIEEIAAAMKSADTETQILGMQEARRLLSIEPYPPIAELIAHDIVPLCVQFLQRYDEPTLQYEAVWALTNIAAGDGDYTKCVIESGAVPYIVELLDSHSMQLAEQAVWALGNIVADGAEARDLVLCHNVVDGLLRLCVPDLWLRFVSNIVWLMLNLCNNFKSPPPFEEIERLVPELAHVLCCDNVQVQADACWALFYVAANGYERVQAVVDAGAVPQLVVLLGSDVPYIVVPALRCVCCIVAGSDQHIDAVLSAGGLAKLGVLLQSTKNNIVKVAARAVGYILAGTHAQIQAVLDADIFTQIRQVLQYGDFKLQKQAAWAVTNTTFWGTRQQIFIVMEKYEVFKLYCDLLASQDTRTIKLVLRGITTLLLIAEKFGAIESLCLLIEEIGALEKLERLQMHQNEDLYKRAYTIIDHYFSGGDDAEMAMAPTADHGAVELNFNPQATPPLGGYTF